MLTLDTAQGRWRIADAERKLALRGALPGAFGFDRAAAGFAEARRAGARFDDLVAAAMPTSWMVNNRATSQVFQHWLSAPLGEVWAGLAEVLAQDRGWAGLDPETRALVAQTVDRLATQGHGLAAISKVLASLAGESVPLCDDAAVWWALGAVARPESPDTPQAPTKLFGPMLDWFAAAAEADAEALAALASAARGVRLSGPQVLDRLMWFESYGWQLMTRGARWWWVDDGRVQGVVESVEGPAGAPWRRDKIVLAAVDDEAWRRAARDALYGA
ncbi:MAG: hypothetical protein JNK72_03360 [Myxococcales bacterium]|nr:hypothetical protein [Myxococcales bacterium]